MKQKTLTVMRSTAVTLHYALVNYISQLEQEIRKPTREHGAAESAMALAVARPALDMVDKYLEETEPKSRADRFRA